MGRSRFNFSVYVETPWQIDEDAAAMYLKQAIEDSVLGVGVKESDITVGVTIKASSEANSSVDS